MNEQDKIIFDPIKNTLTFPNHRPIKLTPQHARYVLALKTNPDGISTRQMVQHLTLTRDNPVTQDGAKVTTSSFYGKLVRELSAEQADNFLLREAYVEGGHRASTHKLRDPENLILKLDEYHLEDVGDYYLLTPAPRQVRRLVDLASCIASNIVCDTAITPTTRDYAYTLLVNPNRDFTMNQLVVVTQNTLQINHAPEKAHDEVKSLAEALKGINLSTKRPSSVSLDSSEGIAGIIQKPGRRRIFDYDS